MLHIDSCLFGPQTVYLSELGGGIAAGMALLLVYRVTAFVVLVCFSSFSVAVPNLLQPLPQDQTFTSATSVSSSVSHKSQADQASQQNGYRNVAYYVVS